MDEKKRKERENGKSGFACFCITVFDELWYLVKLNLLFLVGCVPIVTIPMAFTAALRVTSLLAQERRLPLWQTFRKAYLGEWKRALPCGWVFALLQALAGFGVFAYGMMMQENPLALLPLLAALVIFAVLAVAGLYFHSMLAMCELSLADMLRNAFILAVLEGWRNVAALLALVACGLIAVLLFPATLPLTIFLLPALGMLAASFAIRRGLGRCMRSWEERNGETE